MDERGNREDWSRETPGWRRYLRFWAREAARDHDDELSFHLAMRERDLVRSGMAPEDAAREARQSFGDFETIRRRLDEQQRRRSALARRTVWLEELRGDLRIALRSFVRRPAFAASAAGTLMLGIGATTAVFSLVEGIVLRPLPYPHPERLAVIWERNVPRARAENVVSMSNFEAWRDRSRSFDALAALAPHRGTILGEVPERVYGGEVTTSWFEVVGISPAIGRGFRESDVTQGSRVIVLSDGLWRERFGGDASAIGGTLILGSNPYTIVGVMPRTFEPPAFGWLGKEQRYWVPFGPTPENRAWGRAFLVLGRLREESSIGGADLEMKAIAGALEREDPRDEGWTADVVGLKGQVVGNARAALWTLMVAVSFLLALAAVNAANLVLARAQGRAGEFSLRVALGAGRSRLSRQLLAEALALAMFGAPLGVLLAFGGVRGLRSVLPADLPRAESIGLNTTVLAFAALVTIGAVLFSGVLPAVRLSRARVETGLRTSSGRVAAPAGANGLIVLEIALALLLTAGALLTVRSFIRLAREPLGFDASGVLATRLSLTGPTYENGDARLAFMMALMDRLDGESGIESAALVTFRPLRQGGPATGVYRPQKADLMASPVVDIRVASSSYFSTLRIPLHRGQIFDDDNVRAGTAQTVINQTLATTLWPGEDPIGSTLRLAWNDEMEVEVVGVVDDVRLDGPRSAIRSAVYLSYHDWVPEEFDVVVRSSHATEGVVARLREAVRALDRTRPLYATSALADDVSDAMAQDRTTMLLLGGFSAVALLLAAAGVYGILALHVGQRRPEIGIRLALGASAAAVASAVVGGALRLSLLGVVAGTAAGLALTRYMSSLLYGVKASDPLTFVLTGLILIVVALAASWIPARRATRVDPAEVVRAG
jgi:predicted permease